MATKLKLVLKNPIFQLAFKALIFWLFLYWFSSGAGWAVILFLVAASWLYFRPLFNSLSFWLSFAVLLFLSLWIMPLIDNFFFAWLALTFFSFLFFILLGLKNFFFIERKNWYFFLNFSLFYLTLLSFFLVDKSTFFLLKWLLFLLAVYLLFKELFKVALPELADRTNILSLVLVLIMGQLLWVVSWLPIGFLSSTNLMVLVLFLLVNLIVNHFEGTLKKKLVVKDLVFFLILMVFVFFTSSWQI